MRDEVGVDGTTVRGGVSARGMGDQRGNSCCMGKERVCHGAVQVRTSFVGLLTDDGLGEVTCLRGIGLDEP